MVWSMNRRVEKVLRILLTVEPTRLRGRASSLTSQRGKTFVKTEGNLVRKCSLKLWGEPSTVDWQSLSELCSRMMMTQDKLVVVMASVEEVVVVVRVWYSVCVCLAGPAVSEGGAVRRAEYCRLGMDWRQRHNVAGHQNRARGRGTGHTTTQRRKENKICNDKWEVKNRGKKESGYENINRRAE